MENAGAVFFRETLLLLDPATVSLPERKRAAEVIAHELAHMWYGDLVTMAWWDDLWLNEAFATWMAYRVVDEWKPEWRMWQDFEHDRAGALGLDALASTHPIYAPVRSVAQATRELRPHHLREGRGGRADDRALPRRRRVPRRRAALHASATARATRSRPTCGARSGEASGADVARVAQAWIEQPGFPLRDADARAGARCASGRSASSPIPASRRRSAGSAGPCRWSFASAAREPATGRRVRWCSPRRRACRLPAPLPAWCYGNAGAGGFYRVRHDPETQAALLGALGVARRRRAPRAGRRPVGARARRPRGRSPPSSISPTRSARRPITTSLDGVAAALAVVDEQVVEHGQRGAGGAPRLDRTTLRSGAARARLGSRRGRARRGPAPARGAAAPRRGRRGGAGRAGRGAPSPRRVSRGPRRARAEPRRRGGVARRPGRRRRALRALSRGRCRRADAAGAAPLPAEPRVLPDSGDRAAHARRAADARRSRPRTSRSC